MTVDRNQPNPFSRRRFLTGSVAAAALIATGCSDDGPNRTATGPSTSSAAGALRCRATDNRVEFDRVAVPIRASTDEPVARFGNSSFSDR